MGDEQWRFGSASSNSSTEGDFRLLLMPTRMTEENQTSNRQIGKLKSLLEYFRYFEPDAKAARLSMTC